jgi:hypothetical protein
MTFAAPCTQLGRHFTYTPFAAAFESAPDRDHAQRNTLAERLKGLIIARCMAVARQWILRTRIWML